MHNTCTINIVERECRVEFKNTETYKNIKDSFLNEAKAIISYIIYADIAKEEGKENVAELFEKMAQNEIKHAKTWFKYIYDTNKTTAENLVIAADTENSEWKTSYPEAAKKAQEEGFSEIASMFERIASIECDHERRFVEMLLSEGHDKKSETVLEENTHFCLFCGFPAASAMGVCPVCGASDAFVAEN